MKINLISGKRIDQRSEESPLIQNNCQVALKKKSLLNTWQVR